FLGSFLITGLKPVFSICHSYGTNTPNPGNPIYHVHPIPILIFNLRHLRNLRESFFSSFHK
ncbi:MAG: hypothetical protein WBK79_02445, partial [Candidatus Cloacimonas acidaminovorans]